MIAKKYFEMYPVPRYGFTLRKSLTDPARRYLSKFEYQLPGYVDNYNYI